MHHCGGIPGDVSDNMYTCCYITVHFQASEFLFSTLYADPIGVHSASKNMFIVVWVLIVYTNPPTHILPFLSIYVTQIIFSLAAHVHV